ncbi:hypothetical protein OAE00_00840 [bacterium]|nr:hypothetical protein [bacterium]
MDHMSTTEYWTLDRIATTNNVTVTLGWTANSGGVDNLTDLTVARWDVSSSIWRDQGNGGTTGNTTAGTIVSSGTVNAFSPFTLASTTSNNPLPVSLVSFEAIPDQQNNEVHLTWKTSSELNNDFFTIEKTIDLETYQEVAIVTGIGTTNDYNSYSTKDLNPSSGLSYYRLKQTDYNGDFKYYDLKKIEFEYDNLLSNNEIVVYSNPNLGDMVYLQIPQNNFENYQIILTNVSVEILILNLFFRI